MKAKKPKPTARDRGYVDADEAIKSLRAQIDALERDIEGRGPLLMKINCEVWIALKESA